MGDTVWFTRSANDTPDAMAFAENETFLQLVEWANESLARESRVRDFALFAPACAAGLKQGLTCCFEDVHPDLLSVRLDELGFAHKIGHRGGTDGVVVHASSSNEHVENIGVWEEDASYGRLLGVPEEDLRWYDEPSTPDISDVTPITGFLDMTADEWPDLDYARLSPWIARPTEDGVRRTIQIGKAWYRLAERLDANGFSDALAYAERQRNREDHPWYPSIAEN